jgi:hypothetical protein
VVDASGIEVVLDKEWYGKRWVPERVTAGPARTMKGR